jgi:hypothetical protein
MRKTLLVVVALAMGGMAPAGARGPLKCKPSEVCAVKEVVLISPVDVSDADEIHKLAKEIIERTTWLRIVDQSGPETGKLYWSEFTSRIEANSDSNLNRSQVGRTTTYVLTLEDARGNIMWTEKVSQFHGVVATSFLASSEAHEVHADREKALGLAAWSLSKHVKGCGIVKPLSSWKAAHEFLK